MCDNDNPLVPVLPTSIEIMHETGDGFTIACVGASLDQIDNLRAIVRRIIGVQSIEVKGAMTTVTVPPMALEYVISEVKKLLTRSPAPAV